MGMLLLAIFATALAAVLGAHLGASGDEVAWWSVDSAPPQGSSQQGYGMNQWFTIYPDSYNQDDNNWITSTTPPPDNSQLSGGYHIIDLRT